MNPKPRTTNGLYRRNTEWSAVFRTDAVKAAELPLWLAGDSASVKVLIKYLCNLTAA